MIKNTFEPLGIDLKQVSTVAEAETMLKKSSFDVILTDLMLHSKNITDYVKDTLYGFNIPIIVFSAITNFSTDNLDIRFLQKPMELDALTDYMVSFMYKNMYDVPQLENIYRQYDNDPSKTNKYLTILIEEFNQYHSRILTVLETKDQ